MGIQQYSNDNPIREIDSNDSEVANHTGSAPFIARITKKPNLGSSETTKNDTEINAAFEESSVYTENLKFKVMNQPPLPPLPVVPTTGVVRQWNNDNPFFVPPINVPPMNVPNQ